MHWASSLDRVLHLREARGRAIRIANAGTNAVLIKRCTYGIRRWTDRIARGCSSTTRAPTYDHIGSRSEQNDEQQKDDDDPRRADVDHRASGIVLLHRPLHLLVLVPKGPTFLAGEFRSVDR